MNIFDYKKHMLFMEDERTYLQNDDSTQSDLRSREKSLLPSENLTDDDYRYLFWGDAVVCADHKTLINILHAAGIELQVDVDFEHEVVYFFISRGYCIMMPERRKKPCKYCFAFAVMF